MVYTGPVYIPNPNEIRDSKFFLDPGDYLMEVMHPMLGGTAIESSFDGSWVLYATYPGSAQEVQITSWNGADFAGLSQTRFTIDDNSSFEPAPTPTPTPDEDSEEEGGGGEDNQGYSCIWTAWLEECTSAGGLRYRQRLEDFEDVLSSMGDDGFHLVAADYEDGVGWMGFFQELPRD